MDIQKKDKLKDFAKKLRISILDQVYFAQSGHPGGSLSIADIIAYLYLYELNIDPKQPYKHDRDRFILSKGHASPAYYAVLAHMGYFDMSELDGFRKINRRLQGHPDYKNITGVDASTGSLSHGFSVACGMAVSAKLSNDKYRVFAILGDGELQEGQIWEACMFASHYKLDNLVAIIDNNDLQIDGSIRDVCSPYPIDEKFISFGFHVINIDAHNFDEIEKAFLEAKSINGKPVAIIAKSLKGKGVSFMENRVEWHGVAPSQDKYLQALKELNEILEEQ